MVITSILVFVLLHIAFALAIGFALLVVAAKQEGWLKTLGAIFGWVTIVLALLLMLISTINAIRFATDDEFRQKCPMYQHHKYYHKHHEIED